MSVPPATRVLIVDFGAIARQGFRETLVDLGFDVIGDCSVEEIEDRLRREEPDVVVIDLDRRGTRDLVERIAVAHPAVKVIACSAEQPRMRVYPDGGTGQSYTTRLDSESLAQAVQG